MVIYFLKRVQFKRANGERSIAMPAIQIGTNKAWYMIGLHGYHVMRIHGPSS